ncbi:hypothetical protein B0A48_05124 [Cryoendolithus antarcticus]|uniref:Zinc finger PHD-type domain-containing protein n=1 Tax=Cryoendolithus antarcticus TaxID=1507870 RepID=A0A1V8TEM6_9PEZI|nr:hypothetical protein B0A48_05124 [Cryoendolithus antarcticus]
MLPFLIPLAMRPARPLTETQWQQHEAVRGLQTYQMAALPTRGGRPQKQLVPAPLVPQPIEDAESLFVTEDIVMTTSADRMLNSDGSRPDTFCHAAVYLRIQPHHHKLRCGHEVVTVQIKACGDNCEMMTRASPPTGLKFSCPDSICKRKATREASASPFIPTKSAKAKMTWKCEISTVKGTDAEAGKKREDEVKVARQVVAAKKRQLDLLKFENPGPKTLEEFLGATLRVGRDRSRSPGRDDEKKYRTREYERSVRPQRFTARTTKLEQMKPDYLVDKERPHSYAQAPNKTQAQHDHAGFHSITEEAQDVWQQAREGLAMPVRREVEQRDQMVAEADELEGGKEIKLEFDYQPSHCVCGAGSSDTLVECTACHFYFHPVCVGKGKQDLRSYDGSTHYRARKNDAEYYGDSEDFRCRECEAAHAVTVKKTLTWEEMKAEKARVKRHFTATRVATKAENSQHACSICDAVIVRCMYRCGLCIKNFVICSECARDPHKSSKHRHAGHSGLF